MMVVVVVVVVVACEVVKGVYMCRQRLRWCCYQTVESPAQVQSRFRVCWRGNRGLMLVCVKVSIARLLVCKRVIALIWTY
jgi:uncharacterized protein (DUF488 family)